MSGKIITFYSYKNGLGSSMALANAAWILACNGKKVLAIDWNLESPGLHRYFSPFLQDQDLVSSDGILDLCIRFVESTITARVDEAQDDKWFNAAADINGYVGSLNYVFSNNGSLDLMPAGRQDASYATRANSFDWQRFHDRLGGRRLVQELQQRFREKYDYVLISSRAGVSDTAGICTVQLPDILVPCFTLADQDIDGAAQITNSAFAQRRQSRLLVFPVPVRVDTSESEKLELRSNEARKKFYRFPNYLQDGNAEAYWTEVAVFSNASYPYDGALAVFAEGRTAESILAAAERLTKHLTDGAVDQLPTAGIPVATERKRVLALYAGQTFNGDPQVEFNELAENAFLRLTAEDQAIARRCVERLIRVGADARTYAGQAVDLDAFPPEDQKVFQQLRDSRLLCISSNGTGKDTVEFISLDFLRSWKRLHSWLDEDLTFLSWLVELNLARTQWQTAHARSKSSTNQGEGADALLLKDMALTKAGEWLRKQSFAIYAPERIFILHSQQKNGTTTTPTGQYKKYSRIPDRLSKSMEKAREILGGKQANLAELQALAKELKSETRFSYARRLLLRARNHEDFAGESKASQLKILQQLALCTYKDQDLEPDERFNRAIATLGEAEDLATTTNQETLGMLGAIYKRKWEVDNLRANLDRSLAYYLRGYRVGAEKDQGYTGINAAYVLDQLADLAEGEADEAGGELKVAKARRDSARTIRLDIIDKVEPLINRPEFSWLTSQWWYYATLGEAHFGIGDYDTAVRWLRTGQDLAGPVYEWELETCARQLAAIARFQNGKNDEKSFDNTEPFKALERAFGTYSVPCSAFMGKIGLALSGGGFRASLYHLGVLARLAELDVLRQVEVISCVSGGSIVGAYYYLKVRQLLESKTENEIGPKDYIDIVSEMIRDFLPGVQKNIRTRVALNPLKILQMVWLKGYTRTSRAAELYEECLYSLITPGNAGERTKDSQKSEQAGKKKSDDNKWQLSKLTIKPLTKRSPDDKPFNDENFLPKYQNWRRDAKVPILVLNAATLNTGHTWQFTANWMGESPTGIDSEIDGNDRLRRLYYSDAPEPYKTLQLGQAVGASAAVPGVFEPLNLDKLYPDRIVRLVDGGVCDNQGIGSLFEQDCRVILVSDGSGQMESQRTPGGGILSVLLRSNSVFQARIREAQYHDLKGRLRSGFLKSLMFVHLKGDLEVDPVDWIECQDPYAASDDSRPPARLSAIRTDLDSFSDAEAYSLMVSGYRMTEFQFKHEKSLKRLSLSQTPDTWKFFEIEDSMKASGSDFDYLKKLLEVGSNPAFKVWRIDPWLRIPAFVVLFGVVLWLVLNFDTPLPASIGNQGSALLNTGAGYFSSLAQKFPSLTLSKIVAAALGLFSSFFIVKILATFVGDRFARDVIWVARWRDLLRRAAVAAVLSTVGCVAACLHIYIFDRRFLKLGSLERVKQKGDSGPSPEGKRPAKEQAAQDKAPPEASKSAAAGAS
jgi:predicted acylesterase/phospholipase RssA/MinD-like ATPase involved in chromosome partitioning or flagellar assembly